MQFVVINSGNPASTGVRLKVSGRCLNFNTPVGVIQGGTTKAVGVPADPKKHGKVKASFKVTSNNAGGKTEKKSTSSREIKVLLKADWDQVAE